jgi:signal transduction histidine kinase
MAATQGGQPPRTPAAAAGNPPVSDAILLWLLEDNARLRERIVETSEEERKRWARELHDETLQGLGALQVLLTTGLGNPTPGATERAARQAVEQVAEEIQKLKSLITELRPAALDEIGLQPALESLTERTRTLYGLELAEETNLDYEAGRRPTRLTPEIESTVYRVVQEALTNIAKHARAERAVVTVIEVDGSVRIEVRDDGEGLGSSGTAGGLGVVGMRERLQLAGGSLQIDSGPGAGTTIRAELPATHRA